MGKRLALWLSEKMKTWGILAEGHQSRAGDLKSCWVGKGCLALDCSGRWSRSHRKREDRSRGPVEERTFDLILSSKEAGELSPLDLSGAGPISSGSPRQRQPLGQSHVRLQVPRPQADWRSQRERGQASGARPR